MINNFWVCYSYDSDLKTLLEHKSSVTTVISHNAKNKSECSIEAFLDQGDFEDVQNVWGNSRGP